MCKTMCMRKAKVTQDGEQLGGDGMTQPFLIINMGHKAYRYGKKKMVTLHLALLDMGTHQGCHGTK